MTDRLINYWRSILFIEPVLDMLFIVCFAIGIFHHHKNKERLFFIGYFFSGIIYAPVRIITYKTLTERQDAILLESTNTLFELAEILAFYYFFRRCLQSDGFKRVLRLFFYCLIAIFIIFFIMLTFPGYSVSNIRAHSQFINAIELFFFLSMCLGYYRELFTDIPVKNLYSRPSFLIVTSAFFYSILIIPFFLIASDVRIEELQIHNILFACHYLLLIILLISISKAFLCKAPITT